MRRQFPNLHWYTETSDPTPRYNCHAWAADRDEQWWQPCHTGEYRLDLPWIRFYWPAGLPPDDWSLENFRRAHGSVGFAICGSGSLELGYEKIAHYVLKGMVTHTARQLPWGTWTSKLGESIDIEHGDPEALEGPKYGHVAGYMRRETQSQLVPSASGLLFTKP